MEYRPGWPPVLPSLPHGHNGIFALLCEDAIMSIFVLAGRTLCSCLSRRCQRIEPLREHTVRKRRFTERLRCLLSSTTYDRLVAHAKLLGFASLQGPPLLQDSILCVAHLGKHRLSATRGRLGVGCLGLALSLEILEFSLGAFKCHSSDLKGPPFVEHIATKCTEGCNKGGCLAMNCGEVLLLGSAVVNRSSTTVRRDSCAVLGGEDAVAHSNYMFAHRRAQNFHDTLRCTRPRA
eukprot:scaffold290982_cov28-Tisochrysis_lutea.AAC.2